MFPILETALAFVGVMLAASLMVTAIVRMIHSMAGTRKRGVPNMLIRLHHGFRQRYGDHGKLGDAYERQFVIDVLKCPVLHTTERYTKLKPAIDRLQLEHAFVDPEAKELLRYEVDEELYNEAYLALSESIEYLSCDDLVSIVKESSVERGGQCVIPGSWRANIPDDKASCDAFVDYLREWFPTVEGTISQEFGERARRLAVIVSCTIVVLLNLDGIRLAQSLHKNRVLTENLVSKLGDLQETAERLDVMGGERRDGYGDDPTPDPSWDDLKLEVQNTSAFLTDDRLSIGWQGSYMSKQWCAYRKACRGAGTAIALTDFLREVVLWLVGLLFSCVLVSQGAPFWINRLRDLLRLKNAVQANKEKRSDSYN